MFLIFFLLFSFLTTVVQARTLQLSYGEIEGKLIRTSEGPHGNQTALVFLGVPYAKPPIGELRFRDAVPPEKWAQTKDCSNFQSSCFGNPAKSGGNMSEDCLYLNVFTNDFCLTNQNCSVIVVVHGGMMINHSPKSFDSESIINYFVGNGRNVIVVTVAYRLGFFGFAHLNGPHGAAADANVGITDVLEAVRFLNKEVGHFGGDRQKITLYGHSSGAKVVSILAMTPMSAGLYDRQIIMSFAQMYHSKHGSTKGTHLMATRMGCNPDGNGSYLNEETVSRVFNCLRNKSSEELFLEYLNEEENEVVQFGIPWIDGKVILPDDEREKIEFQRRSTLIGNVDNEVKYALYTQHKNGTPKMDEVRELCTVIAFEKNYERPLTLIEKCVEFYSKSRNPSHMVDDLDFLLTTYAIAEDVVNGGKNVFLYRYSYKTEPEKMMKESFGVIPRHGDEQSFIFQNRKIRFDWGDYQIQYIMTGIISDFATHGSPSRSLNQKWSPYSLENREYFHIDFDQNFTMPGMKSDYYSDIHQFWTQTAPLFGGDHHTLNVFPPSFDIPQWLIFANSKSAIEFNETDEKTLECRRRAIEEISIFVQQIHRDYQLKNDRGLITIGVFSVVLIILMFSIASFL